MIDLKVCCIRDIAEAELAISLGATAIGLVSAMPSGPGVIAEDTIRRIVVAVPRAVGMFLLTSATTTHAIVAQQRFTHANTLQFVDTLKRSTLSELRAALPVTRLVQVIHVRDERALAEARAIEPYVDALLLDSGDPNAAVRTLGGTGHVHDWAVSRRICEAVDLPVYLAGGLRPDNIAEAVASVRPTGVDVCSGLRTDDALDADKLRAFVSALRAATPSAPPAPAHH